MTINGKYLAEWPNRTVGRFLLRFSVGIAAFLVGYFINGLDFVGFYGVFVSLFAVGSLPFLIRDARTRLILYSDGLRITRGKHTDEIPYDSIVSLSRSDDEQFERAAFGLLILLFTFELKKPGIYIDTGSTQYVIRGNVWKDINALYWRIKEATGDVDTQSAESLEKLNHPSFGD